MSNSAPCSELRHIIASPEVPRTSSSGAEFDTAFADAQLRLQTAAVAQYGAYSRRAGNDARLRRHATDATPSWRCFSRAPSGIADGHAGVGAGHWEASRFVFTASGFELEGTTVGLVGAGATGSRVARILIGFGARVLVFDPYAAPGSLPHGVTRVSLEELLASAQVVSLHARVTPENREMIGAAQLAAMPPGAVLINCARGALVDHAALAEALRGGHLFAAGLDVFDEEPLPADHPLRGAPNVVMTPHLAGASRQVAGNACRMVAAEADRFRRGEPPAHCANPDVLGRQPTGRSGGRR